MKITGHGYDSGFVPRGEEPPTPTDRGFESHPAWIKVTAFRSQTTGKVLFDSDIIHRTIITVKIETAERKRELNQDYIYGGKQIVEFEMSEAQWASFLSTMNSSGVPATLTWYGGADNPQIPSMPHEPRMVEQMQETKEAGKKATADIRRAMAAYKEKKTVGNLRHLEAMIDNLPANLRFAEDMLAENAENVVTRARADIEAFVLDKARSLGLDPGDIGSPLQLGTGEDE